MLIFFYGTLRESNGNHRMIAEAGGRLVKRCKTKPGYTLYQCLGLPMLANKGTTKVHGEVYAIEDDRLSRIHYMELGAGYELLPVSVPGFKDGEVLAYFSDPEQWGGGKKVKDGDYFNIRGDNYE